WGKRKSCEEEGRVVEAVGTTETRRHGENLNDERMSKHEVRNKPLDIRIFFLIPISLFPSPCLRVSVVRNIVRRLRRRGSLGGRGCGAAAGERFLADCRWSTALR